MHLLFPSSIFVFQLLSKGTFRAGLSVKQEPWLPHPISRKGWMLAIYWLIIRLFYKRLPLFMPRQRNVVCIDSRYCGFCSSCQCSSMETNSQDLVCWDSCYCHQGLFYQSLQYYPFLLKSDTFLFFWYSKGALLLLITRRHTGKKEHWE